MCPRDSPTRRDRSKSVYGDDLFADPRTGVALAVSQSRNVRSRCRCSVCPAIHINSRSWLRSSSTHEPSDPPHRVVSVLNRCRPPAQHGRKSCALAPENSDPETCVQHPPEEGFAPQVCVWFKQNSWSRKTRGKRGGCPSWTASAVLPTGDDHFQPESPLPPYVPFRSQLRPLREPRTGV